MRETGATELYRVDDGVGSIVAQLSVSGSSFGSAGRRPEGRLVAARLGGKARAEGFRA